MRRREQRKRIHARPLFSDEPTRPESPTGMGLVASVLGIAFLALLSWAAR